MTRLACILLVLLPLTLSGCHTVGQVERRVHTWTQAQSWYMPATLGAAAVSQAWYAQAQYAGSVEQIHPAQTAFTWSIHAAAYSALDRRSDYVAFSLLSDFAFQCLISRAWGRGCGDAAEGATWDLYGYDVPKPFHGRGRWAQLGLGIGLVIVPRIIWRIGDAR